jgi:hypothetical protein
MKQPSPYEIIDDYCQQQQKNACVRDLAFSIYRQQFESLTKDSNTNQMIIDATEKTLLSPGSLVAHVRSAEELLRKQFEDDLKPIKSRDRRDSFWFAVVTGIVSNIIYSLLLIILFIVAKDQLATWLSSLIANKP